MFSCDRPFGLFRPFVCLFLCLFACLFACLFDRPLVCSFVLSFACSCLVFISPFVHIFIAHTYFFLFIFIH